MKTKNFLLNGALLLLPVILWNILLLEYLPKRYGSAIFWKDIPSIVKYTENILRVFVFAIPLFMVISFKTKIQKIGWAMYVLGLAVYFTSWLIVIVFPESVWSLSLIGFMAPAFTTLVWLVGIGFIGGNSYFKIPYLSQIYISLSTVFVLFHSLHTYIVFQQF